ncbi:expressed unknown protein [Seminavis robusta]|uniref:J domain-containing protein n=1 Tax=Seminavis robusta TaxID=568900 RepID=A0A9N8HGD6_9STRA|nr:expressed unknown protein [Seminavis robusta]|eukprot:Sro504_g156010.1 n/a (560) ;mRNA; r:39860-41705
MSSRWNEARERRYQYQRQESSRREVQIKVPKDACGLIVGKGGRNVKELQRHEGIRYIKVDFSTATVKIVGTEEGIAAAQRRIDQAVCIAVNSASYFPERTMTCLQTESGVVKVRFNHTASFKGEKKFGGVRLEQLDVHRDYYVIQSVGDSNNNDGDKTKDSAIVDVTEMDKEGIIPGYSSEIYTKFLEEVLRDNAEALAEASACTSIGVNFGKTFLSSIPDEAQDVSLCVEDISGLSYGKQGIRPEFVRHFHLSCRDLLLTAVLDDYVPMESGKVAVIHCISRQTKKRYTIKLKYRKDGEADNNVFAVIKETAEAKSLFEVLGVDDSSRTSTRDIETAFQWKRQAICNPQTKSHPQSGQAMELLNEARRILSDDNSRASYRALPASRMIPRNRFVYSDSKDKKAAFPEILEFRSKVRKLGLLTFLGIASRTEFRTTIEVEKDEAVELAVRKKLQEAWDGDTFNFQEGTDDWLIVETVRYKYNEKYSNGKFTLSIDKTKEEHFGKVMDGVNFSLKSDAVSDALDRLATFGDDPGTIDDLTLSLRSLQDEAEKLSNLLSEV